MAMGSEPMSDVGKTVPRRSCRATTRTVTTPVRPPSPPSALADRPGEVTDSVGVRRVDHRDDAVHPEPGEAVIVRCTRRRHEERVRITTGRGACLPGGVAE